MKHLKRCLTLLLATVLLVTSVNLEAFASDGTSNTVTRMEWLSKLVETFEMTVDEENYPDHYFTDVEESSDYYTDFLTAVEYGLVDVEYGENVYPEAEATRDFAVSTLNYCLGFVNENETYTFSDSADCADPDSAQVAVDCGWVSLVDGKFEPSRPITEDEMNVMIAEAQAVIEDSEIDENYNSQYVFGDHVVVFSETAETEISKDDVVTITNGNKTLEKGDTFVVWSYGIPVFYVAESITQSGTKQVITTSEADVETALLSVDAEGSVALDIRDFEGAEGFDVEYIETAQQARSAASLYGISVKKDSVIATYTHDYGNGVKAILACNLTDLKLNHKAKGADKYYLSVSGGYTLDTTVAVDFMKLFDEKTSITIGTANVAGVGDVTISIELDLSGQLQYHYEGVFEIGVRQSINGKVSPIKTFKKTDSYCNTEVNAKVGVKIKFDVGVYYAKGEIYAEAGIKAKYSSREYGTGRPSVCSTLRIWLYAVAGYNVRFGKDKLAFKHSDSVTIYDEKNSPIQLYYHKEDGKQVLECTRGLVKGKTSSYDSRYGFSNFSWGDGSGGMSSTGTGKNGEVFTLYDYELDDDNNATITDYHGNAGTISIPTSLDGYTVTRIGEGAFEEQNRLETVIVPDTVTRIDGFAFAHCGNLNLVVLSKNLEYLGAEAFGYCSSLRQINIPKTLETAEIGYNGVGPFNECLSLRTVTFDDGVEEIPKSLFHSCYGLKNVVIPDSVKIIREAAFMNSGLESIKLSAKLETLEDCVFWDCVNLKKIELPEGITRLGDLTFFNCISLEEAKLPASLESIGASAFELCDSLKAIVIPEKVTSIGANAFTHCINMKTVQLNEGLQFIGNDAFKECESLEKIAVPNTVVELGAGSFWGCKKLSEVKLGTGITGLNNDLFYECAALTSVRLPYSIEWIAPGVFVGCKKLAEIEIPRGIYEIDEEAFTNLKNLTIYGVSGTLAEQFADEFGYSFEERLVKAAALTLNHTSLDLKDDARVLLIANVTPDNFTDKVTWTSSNEDVAVVSKNGQVTVVGLGTATIKVKVGSLTANCKITNYCDEKLHEKTTKVTKKATLTTNGTLQTVCSVCGKVLKKSTIQKIGSVKLAATKYTYDGEVKKPKVVVKDAKGNTISSSYYDVTYASGRKAVGKYKVTVKFKDRYSGTKSITFTIVPKAPTLSSVTAGGRSFTAKWKKISSQASGYQIYYATKKDFSNAKKVFVKSASTVSKKISSLTAGTKYYVKVRTYKTVDGEKIYSAWSTVKTVVPNPVSTSLTSVTAGGRSFTAKWKKATSQTSGYQIQYATNSSFKSAKSVTVSGISTVSKKVTGLTAGTKYYVRVRAYRTVDGTKYYSAWSSTKTVTPNPVSTTLKSVTAGSKKMTVKWNQVSTQVTGYQIQYATSSSFKSAETVKVAKASTVSKEIKGLKKGKKYYVRIRTYRVVSGKTYYSVWSTSKNVTVK